MTDVFDDYRSFVSRAGGIKLNLGCGQDIRKGWVNIDRAKGDGVNIVHDITKRLPFEDESVDFILVSHVLEHIIHFEDVIPEFHRVLKPGGILEVRVPYAKDIDQACAPYHIRFFGRRSLDNFIKDSSFYSGGGSLDSGVLFKLRAKFLSRVYPFRWHVAKYTGLRLDWLGRPWQITWVLEKEVER